MRLGAYAEDWAGDPSNERRAFSETTGFARFSPSYITFLDWGFKTWMPGPSPSKWYLQDQDNSCRAARAILLGPLITSTSIRSNTARSTGAGLALFLVSPLGPARHLSRGLGRRHRRPPPRFRRKVMGFATLNPSYVLARCWPTALLCDGP